MIDGLVHLEPEQFDELVSEVMDELPQEWAPLLDNIAVVVEEEPSEDDLPSDTSPGTTLLGIYRGVGVPVQYLGGGLAGPAMTAPPEIALFQGPLERASDSLADLRERVHHTLVHEIGHHFGYSEERLREEDEEGDDGMAEDEEMAEDSPDA